MRARHLQPEQPSEIAGHVALATRAADVLGTFRLNPHPGGQYRDDNGIWWCPTNAEDWARGGHGTPLPRMDDPVTVLALVALVRELGNAMPETFRKHLRAGVQQWLMGRVSILVVAHRAVEALEHHRPRRVARATA